MKNGNSETNKYIKADQTKKKILDTSLNLFLKHGYEKTTMRSIAEATGLAPGAAYYHFDTKEHIIFAFYEKSYEEHLPIVEKVLAKEKDLKKRLAGAVKAHMQIAGHYHEISKILLSTAIHPDHSLSPFSVQSKELRDKNIDIFRQVIEGTTSKVPDKLKGKLPEMLWMFKMGMIFYWVYDKSPNQRKTFQLIDRSSALIARLIQLSNLPILKGFSEQIVRMFYQYKFY
jgi:AcrR family transcriptional regulator